MKNKNKSEVKFTINEKSERIQELGEIKINLEYWDCECEQNYIHSIKEDFCKTCKTLQEDSPNSRCDEIKKYIS